MQSNLNSYLLLDLTTLLNEVYLWFINRESVNIRICRHKHFSHIHILLKFQSALHFELQFTFEVTNKSRKVAENWNSRKICFCVASRIYTFIFLRQKIIFLNLPLSAFLRTEQMWCIFATFHSVALDIKINFRESCGKYFFSWKNTLFKIFCSFLTQCFDFLSI